jgi:hypothetical protein
VRSPLSYVLDQLLPLSLHGRFLRLNRRTCLKAATITAYDYEHVYRGADLYENGRLATAQLQALALR